MIKKPKRPSRTMPPEAEEGEFSGERYGMWRLLERDESSPNKFVFRAWNETSRRVGLLEFISPRYEPENSRERFSRRREALGDLRHPCIVPMLDWGSGPLPFIVEEYAPLGTVHTNFDFLASDLWRTLRMARDVALALEEVHASGTVHRNVEPRNIVMRSLDHAALTGFGGIHNRELSTLTATGERVGARAFAPPESFERGPSLAFDVFCLGAVVHAILLGVREPNPLYSMRTAYVEVSSKTSAYPLSKVNLLLAKMLAFEASARPQSISDVVKQLDEILWMGRLG